MRSADVESKFYVLNAAQEPLSLTFTFFIHSESTSSVSREVHVSLARQTPLTLSFKFDEIIPHNVSLDRSAFGKKVE